MVYPSLSHAPEEYDPPASVSVTTPLFLLLQTPKPYLILQPPFPVQNWSYVSGRRFSRRHTPSSPLLQPSTLLVDMTKNIRDKSTTIEKSEKIRAELPLSGFVQG